MAGENIKKIKCYIKKEWHKLIAKGMVGFIVVACIWTVSKTADVIHFANDLPDTLDSIVDKQAKHGLRIDTLDSLVSQLIIAQATDSTAQKHILDGIEELKTILTEGDNP